MSARKILSNTVAQVLSKALLAIMGILSVKILTNYLSEEDYGNYIYVYEIIAFFGVVADLGIFTIAVKEMSAKEEDMSKILGNIISLRTLLVVIAIIFAVGTATITQGESGYKVPMAVAVVSITLFVNTMNGTIASVLQTKLKMEFASMAAVLGKVLSVGTMAYIALWGLPDDAERGFIWLFVAGVFGAVLSILVTGYFVRKEAEIKYRFDVKLWKRIFKESLPYGIALILNSIYFRIDSILIFNLRGSAELGIYGIAMKVLEQFVLVPMYFMNSVLPVLTRKMKEGAREYRQLISNSFDFLAALAFPIVAGGFALSREIVLLVSAEEFVTREGFAGADLALSILIFALLFQFLSVLFAFILIAKEKQVKLLYINGACAALNVITNLIFIPMYGFVGAAITSVFCELFILIVSFVMARKALDFEISVGNFVKILMSAVMMGLMVWYVEASILILVPMGAAVYGALLWGLGVVNKNTLQMLKRR